VNTIRSRTIGSGRPFREKKFDWAGAGLAVFLCRAYAGVAWVRRGLAQQGGCDMADSKANAEIAREFYERWNARDFDRVAEMMANDGEIVLVGSDTRFRGPVGAIEFSRMWADGFPDGRVEVDRSLASGDCVCLEFTGTGTHTGTLRGPGGDIPATGRSVTLHFCDVHEIRNGKISSVHSYFDSASMLTQLGVMPELRVGAKA
jgi:steroid delta-isomerase-like uncharacterized protein